MYDVSYSYPLNDGMTITPFVYVVEKTGTDDETTVMVKHHSSSSHLIS